MAQNGPTPGEVWATPDGKQYLWTGQGWIDGRSPQAAQFLVQNNRLDPTAFESFGAGMSDVWEGARWAVGASTPERDAQVAEDRALFQAGATSGLDKAANLAGKIVMGAGITAPVVYAGGESLIGRSVAGGAAGGFEGYVRPADSGAQRFMNTTVGAVTGAAAAAAAPPVMQWLGKQAGKGTQWVRRLMTGASPRARAAVDSTIDDAARVVGISASDIDSGLRDRMRAQVLSAMSEGEELTGQQLARRLRAEMAGFTGDAAPTRSQVTRVGAQFGDERNLARTQQGDALASRFANQEARANEIMEGFKSRPGAVDPLSGLEAGERAVRRRAGELQAGVSQAYDSARAGYSATGIDAAAFERRMSGVMREWEDSLPTAVRNRVAELREGGRVLEPLELEKLDKLVNSSISPIASDAEHTAAAVMRRELVRLWGDSGYEQAKRLASERFRLLGGSPKSLANRMRREQLAPNQIVSVLQSGHLRDVQRLKRLIGNEPEWDQLGDAVLQKMISKAFSNAGDELGGQALRPRVLVNMIEEMGQRRLNVLFGEQRGRALWNFSKSVNDLFTSPSGSTENFSNTAITQARGLLTLMRWAMGTPAGQAAELGANLVGGAARRQDVARALDPGLRAAAPQIFGQRGVDVGRLFGPAAGAASGAELQRLLMQQGDR